MSEYSDFVTMLRTGSWDEGDVNYDDLLKAANIIERMEQQLAHIKSEGLKHTQVLEQCVDEYEEQLAELREAVQSLVSGANITKMSRIAGEVSVHPHLIDNLATLLDGTNERNT